MVAYSQYEWLYNFFIYSVIIPIGLGLARWRSLTQSERWVVAFLTALLVDELLSVLCIALHTRNHFLFNIQTVTVLGSVAGVYDGTIGTKRLLWKIALGISVLMVLEVTFWVGFNYINSVTLSISRLLPALYAVVNLNRLFTVQAYYPLIPNPRLYIHLGFFIFGAFSAVTTYFMSYFIETSLELFHLFNNMSGMMGAVAFGFFSIGFLRVKSA